MSIITEDSRNSLIRDSKRSDSYKDQSKGKNRYQRRLRSKVASSVKQYNSIDMNKLFKENILDVAVEVHGETSVYEVRMSFAGFLDQLHRQLKQNNDILNLRVVIKSLVAAFNSDDVYVHCNCPDWAYRFSYWSTVNDTSADPSIEQKDNGKGIANPNDTKGRGCKHVLLVLSNNSWLTKVASTIYNYINYMEKHYQRMYADVIYPAIYEKDYEEPVQLDIFSNNDENNLDSDQDSIDKSNEYAVTKNRFKPGNTSGMDTRFKSKKREPQFDFDNSEDENQ